MRTALIAVITLLLAMSVYVVVFGSWMSGDVADRPAFVASAVESFELDGSYEAIGNTVAERIGDEFPALGLVDAAGIFTVLFATEPFQPMLEGVAVDIHARLFDGAPGPVVVDLAEYRELIVSTVGTISPGLVDLLPADLFRSYVLFEAGRVPDIADQADTIAAAAWIALIAAVALCVILVLVVRTSSTVLFVVGIASILAAAAGFLIVPVGSASLVATIQDPEYLVLARNMYDVVTADLTRRVTIVGLLGVIFIVGGALGWLTQRRAASSQAG